MSHLNLIAIKDSALPHTLFISDLHLEKDEPAITATFLDFLHTEAAKADALYILGDFFEVWIGDDDQTPFNQKITHALRQFTASGTPTYFMHGNRDFLIGRRFAKATGVTLLQDPSIVTVYGKPLYLTHGDALCTYDIAHQKLRKKTTNKFYQRLALLMPLWFRRAMARKLREHSHHRGKTINADITDVSHEEVSYVMQQSGVTQMIHGHTHRPDVHHITVNQQPAQRIVLGSWHNCGSALVFKDDGQFELTSFPHVVR